MRILWSRIRNTGKRYLIFEQLDLLKGVEGVSLPLRVAIDHQLAQRLQLVSQLDN
jgi:hypothetical protein